MRTRLLWCALALCAACGRQPKPVQDLTGQDNVSAYKLTQVTGHRDGDLAEAEAHFSDGSATLTVHLRFAVGSPTRLESGWWRWTRPGHLSGGNVVARSVMFLGGQNGPPSIGGSYDLLDTHGSDRYRIYIPTTELETRVPTIPQNRGYN